ncbi:LHFPL tetraspan subfamily member 2 protein isoform X2 [Delphinapterus leucas]|uniref:LHFPL tetraspan subfamily member 2 protein isoform X2 n=1 Tax=Delphinapterus leucas TaxID=9749 RepID=A0A2Y9Q3T9_DELLE|nr:LHFPL tetraspan subfamily member 2 protein isoform X2 [Delphinapterus leucas]XP_022450054.1 LHFPL tetraspan subfamily member 2 protein isoform X2 [Delphinapterus leucas]XP_022450063.1 LHFPL tetraspan subfamily member 2 protein isoform X2 [Delphinapterus leucas]XP_022450070.1 LHFPL tetraspan subfamily member 2 protein isoform X2 [Delphinapterus leucas]
MLIGGGEESDSDSVSKGPEAVVMLHQSLRSQAVVCPTVFLPDLSILRWDTQPGKNGTERSGKHEMFAQSHTAGVPAKDHRGLILTRRVARIRSGFLDKEFLWVQMMIHLAGSFWFGISQEMHSAGGWGHFKDFFNQVSGAGLFLSSFPTCDAAGPLVQPHKRAYPGSLQCVVGSCCPEDSYDSAPN